MKYTVEVIRTLKYRMTIEAENKDEAAANATATMDWNPNTAVEDYDDVNVYETAPDIFNDEQRE